MQQHYSHIYYSNNDNKNNIKLAKIKFKKNTKKLISIYFIANGGRLIEFSGVVIAISKNRQKIKLYNSKFRVTAQFLLNSPLIVFIKFLFFLWFTYVVLFTIYFIM